MSCSDRAGGCGRRAHRGPSGEAAHSSALSLQPVRGGEKEERQMQPVWQRSPGSPDWLPLGMKEQKTFLGTVPKTPAAGKEQGDELLSSQLASGGAGVNLRAALGPKRFAAGSTAPRHPKEG